MSGFYGEFAAEADGAVLKIHVASGNYYGLNEVASFIWNQLDKPRTLAVLCAAIQAEFQFDEKRCLADALVFLHGMIEDGLARVVGTMDGP